MTRNGVLIVSNFLSRKGLNRAYAEDLADRLEQRGWAVTRTSEQVGRTRRLADMLATAWIRRHAYSVAQIDVFSGPAFVWAEAVCFQLARLGKPYTLTLHGGNLPAFARRWPRRIRRLLGSAVEVTAPSGYLYEQMRPYRADIVLRRNAIDVANLAFRTRAAVQPRLVWVRAFHAIYNPVLAIDALARVRLRAPEATLAMLGPDKGDGSLAAVHRRILELGLDSAVRVLGAVPKREVAAYLDAADVFLNTASIDNTPLSVLEAMTAGLCVVTTSVGGIPYLVEDGTTGLLVAPDDADAMAGAVQRLLDHPDLAARISGAAHAAAGHHDWARVLEEWEVALRAIQDAT